MSFSINGNKEREYHDLVLVLISNTCECAHEQYMTMPSHISSAFLATNPKVHVLENEEEEEEKAH